MADLRREVREFCPVEAGLQLISGRWKARILMKLYQGKLRFGELRRRLDGITEKMLAQQLRELERDRLVTRTVYPEVPPKVEYALSHFGQSLAPVLDKIVEWGTGQRGSIEQIATGKTHAKPPRREADQ